MTGRPKIPRNLDEYQRLLGGADEPNQIQTSRKKDSSANKCQVNEHVKIENACIADCETLVLR